MAALTAPIVGKTGKPVKLADEMFGVELNQPLLHEVVRAEAAARRAGTHSAKTRGQVRGGGAKPYRQKGTGRARQGTIRRSSGAAVPSSARRRAATPSRSTARPPARRARSGSRSTLAPARSESSTPARSRRRARRTRSR
jgi:large subunit ribosomal protein L4